MKHGQISSKELTDFIRERSTIEEAYARSMTKLAKSAGNFSQLGTFAPVWDVFKSSTEKLASCHMELVRKLQELIKEVQKYVEEQAKAHKKTKEEVASTLEAVQNIQTISQALQKSKEIYNAKTVEQERLRKEGATQRDVDKAGVKAKKATETYKAYVEKYATAKSEFEQKMAETAQKFQDIEESHILHMKEIIQSYSQSVDETHIQIGELHSEFVRNIENTSVESLIQKLAESKGTGKERPGKPPQTFMSVFVLGPVPVPALWGWEGCIERENSFYSSSDSEDEEEPRKFHVEIKPVEPNNGTHQNRATIDELKASIGNIILSPSTLVWLCDILNSKTPKHRPVAVLLCCATSLLWTSRGPSPVTLASQDALPIAVAFTESVNAYFKGADPTKCIVKITGDMTLSFPMGIIKVFTTNPSPAVLTFKLKNTSRLEQILPNQQLLYSDPSQSDSNSKDFWFNMQALTSYLRKASDQNPSASYFNVDILKYQVLSDGIHSTPLNLAVYWKSTASTTDLRVDYRYNPDSMVSPGPLSNVQILVPVDGESKNVDVEEESRTSRWNLTVFVCVGPPGAGSLRAKFELSDGPSNPSTLAVQFMSEGSTLSGVDMELQGTGYRLSLSKKRFATGM
uniref:FCH and mu domain containing endocytic adaptor 2 n=1 Tax=Scophthalmus maximus TaxID=52904 RepID=A0A8D3CSS5_SCOMX